MKELTSGQSAFYDSFGGLVPVKVISIKGESGPASTAQQVEVKVTKSVTGYPKGDTFITSGLHVAPRTAIKRRKLSTTIGFYTVKAD